MSVNKIRDDCRAHIKRLRAKYGLNPSPSNLSPSDRRIIGTFWEIAFCFLVYEEGRAFTPLQIATNENGHDKSAQWYIKGVKQNRLLLPDVVVWSAPGEHHEIKHKNPWVLDWAGSVFGLEEYRFNALLEFQNTVNQDVLYTIHNYDLADGNLGIRNNINHWVTVSVIDLIDTYIHRQESGRTLYNGNYEEKAILYWSTDLWMPLVQYWRISKRDPVIEWAQSVGGRVTRLLEV